ncbi:response regulator transcription factor, partial [Streptomyces sp. URMC 123]|uniref:response regulator transcription factor n=1 Tax=Streptomyces sp. URMC 123 TaxID=3423403 RepID=UPI003F1E3E17
MRVLVVESDAVVAGALAVGLRRHGHEAEVVDTGAKALTAYHDADLALLDLELPDMDGLEVCRTIRAACDLPIIATTDRGTELGRVRGLRAGADDCLDKPYWFPELMARIEAVTRRVQPRWARQGAGRAHP